MITYNPPAVMIHYKINCELYTKVVEKRRLNPLKGNRYLYQNALNEFNKEIKTKLEEL